MNHYSRVQSQNVVDSSGWLEHLADAPNADFFVPVIEDTQQLVVPTIGFK